MNDTILETSQSHLNASSRITESLERIVSTTRIAESYQLVLENIAVDVWSLGNLNESLVPVGSVATRHTNNQDWNLRTLFSGSRLELSEGVEAGILLPTNVVVERLSDIPTRRHLNFFIYRNAALFQYERNVRIVSPVIHAFLGEEMIYDLYPPVKMIFRTSKVNEDENVIRSSCAFWDQVRNNNMGGWSDEGCVSTNITDDFTTCQCDHMTNFAVMVVLKPDNLVIPKIHQTTLSIITYIGCGLSIFGLGMTLLTFITFRKWRKGNKHQTVFNLSLALISVLVIFLTGIEKTGSKLSCFAVAILLHYFMLSSFAWMLVEAVIQYLNFVKVYGSYVPRFMRKALIGAWGIPLAIVGTVLVIDYELYGEGTKYCWLSNKAFYYSFALPALMMLATNLIIFCLILYSITCRRDSNLRSNQDERKQALLRVQAAFCIYVLLGLSWIFGFLTIGGAHLVFQYLFAITTTLQGFFIFLFFVAKEKTTRELWQDFLSQKSHKSHVSHSTGAISMSQTPRFGNSQL